MRARHGRVRDDGWEVAKALRAQLEAEGKLFDDGDDLAPTTAVSSAESSESEDEEQTESSSEDDLVDFQARVSPALRVQLNLLTIKQVLRRLPELTETQKEAVYAVTGERVSTSKGAACALIRLFGRWDSNECRPEALKELNDIDTRLCHVRDALGMQPVS